MEAQTNPAPDTTSKQPLLPPDRRQTHRSKQETLTRHHSVHSKTRMGLTAGSVSMKCRTELSAFAAGATAMRPPPQHNTHPVNKLCLYALSPRLALCTTLGHVMRS